MDLQLLREETRAQHEATEVLFPLQSAGLDRDRYLLTLRCFYRFVRSWENWASEHAPFRLQAILQERARAHLLLRDLQFFGASPLAAPDADSSPASLQALLPSGETSSPAYEAAFLGSMYVMEGSTLGGQYIARQVESALGLVPGQGDAYFRGHGDRTGAMWNAFREVLAAVSDEHSSVVIKSAKATFRYVEETVKSCPIDPSLLIKPAPSGAQPV